MKNVFRRTVSLFLAASVLSAGSAYATKLSYTTTDILDTGIQDRWQIAISVDDFATATASGLQVSFDYDLYDNIVAETYSPDEWDVLIFQRDAFFGITEDGVLDAMAIADDIESAVFTLSFDWLGDGVSPEALYWETYDSNFSVLESGTASGAAPVPEPVTILLFGTGLAGLAAAGRKKLRIEVDQ